MGLPTGFINGETGVDIGAPLVEKSYLIDRYPELADTFRFAGLWEWGYASSGSLGDGTNTNRSSPVQTISTGANWKYVSRSLRQTQLTLAIKTDGTLWGWGDNGTGNLGNNTQVSTSSPVQTIAGGTNWKQVDAGDRLSLAIKTDGTLWVWGFNYKGSAGTNVSATTNILSPVQTISGGTNWKYVTGGYNITAAIKTDGTLWLWGANGAGQLGDNSVVNKSSPVQTISGGTNWKQVTAGNVNTAAIKTDGTLWTWGGFATGQLGVTAGANILSPVQTVSGGNNWKQVKLGTSTAVAIKTDGTLWTWGSNGSGELGTGNVSGSVATPNQTIAGGTNWKQASTGYNSTAAIKTDGTLWTWGRNYGGALGVNDTTNRSSPVQTIASGTNWKQVSVGGYGNMAAIRDNSSDLFGNSI